MPPSLIILCLSLAAAGALLILHGRRGRRRRNDRWCRACRGMLSGTKTNAAMCPACSANLTMAHAIGVGRRTRRPLMIACGAVLVWMALSLLTARATDWYHTIDWNLYKPSRMLTRQVQSQDAGASLAAINELLHREEAGDLFTPQSDALVDMLIAKVMPAGWETDVPWMPLVQQAWAEGRLSPERALEVARYLTSPSVRFSERDGIHQGTFLRIALDTSTRNRLAMGALLVSSQPLDASLAGSASAVRFDATGQFGRDPSILLPIVVPEGEHELQTTWQIGVQLAGSPGTALSWVETITQQITILPPDYDSFEILLDERTSQLVRDSTQVDLVGIRGFHPETGADVIFGVVHVGSQDIQVAPRFEVWLGSQLVQAAERRTTLVVCVPLQEDEGDEPLKIVMQSTPVRSFDTPGREHDKRPVWYGPPITIKCDPIEWFDSIDDERIPETIRACNWERVLRQLEPRPAQFENP